jgi:hypothetical protein
MRFFRARTFDTVETATWATSSLKISESLVVR